jgi:glycosyltransferase involved in cell wall biosynthesis
MRIFAISAVKNEVDVIEANLHAASEWADKIFVLDNGSTDGTWEKVLSLQNDIITPWKQDAKPFRDCVRSEVYHAFKHLSEPGDWWCIRLDADEFYAEDPREFLNSVPKKYHYVCANFIQFRLTPEDVAGYIFTGDFNKDRPHIRHFEKRTWVEKRFVRYRSRMNWPTDMPFPRNMGIVYPKLINMLHYQYRSPMQIQNRLDVRHAAKKLGHHSPHVTEKNWEEVLVPRSTLMHLEENVDLDMLPRVNNHLHKPYIYFIKHILHGFKILP